MISDTVPSCKPMVGMSFLTCLGCRYRLCYESLRYRTVPQSGT
jgi:hypothetical protein